MYEKFLYLALSLTLLFFSPSAVDAQQATLHPGYTLEFSLAFERVPQSMQEIAQPGERGSVILSSDGQHLLYKMSVGSWRNVVIYDISRATTSSFDTRGINATVQTGGIGRGVAGMRYLPFPAVGFDRIPFIRSLVCSQSESTKCTGEVLSLGGFGQDDTISYFPGELISRSKWNDQDVIVECLAKIPAAPKLPHGGVRSRWQFSDFGLFQSIPLAHRIVYKENTPLRHTDGTDSFEPSTSISFKLEHAVPSALSSSQFDMTTYLNSKKIVMDNTTKRGTAFLYDPKKGSLEKQRDAALKRDKMIELSKGTPIQENPNRTGALVLVALALAGAGAFVWYRVQARSKS